MGIVWVQLILCLDKYQLILYKYIFVLVSLEAKFNQPFLQAIHCVRILNLKIQLSVEFNPSP